MRALVVGGGSWGTAFACVLARGGHTVTLACRDPEPLLRDRENRRYLPGVPLEAGVTPQALDLATQCAESELVVLALPSGSTVEVGRRLSGSAPVLLLAKGLDPLSAGLLSDRLEGVTGPVAVLSGPNHAEEIGRGQPAAAVLASADLEVARALQRAIALPAFRLYASPDVRGVQLAGASKNVIAIASGAADALGFGDNARAALMTRGLAEMTRLGVALGADPRTYSGLAGMGDLIATCTSRHSRNRRAGELLAGGTDPAELETAVGMTVEGVHTAPRLRRLAADAGVELPITEAVCAVLDGLPVRQAIPLLLERALADE